MVYKQATFTSKEKVKRFSIVTTNYYPFISYDMFHTFVFLLGTDPPLPKLPDQYQTIIEVNIVDKNFSLTAFEYFDYVTDKAALTMERNGVKSLLLFDYNTDELFDIRGNLSLTLCMLGNYLCYCCHLLTLFNP